MKVLEPLTIQSSPSRTAVVFSAARSEPPEGSVIAMPQMSSPAAMPGSQRCFCSSVPRSTMYGGQTSAWIPKHEETAALNLENSSAATALNRKSSAPAPPYSSGMSRPSRPCLPASSQTARSIDLAEMKSSARGFRLRSTNSRTDARKASWSGPYTLRGMGYLRVTKRLLSLRQVGHAVNHDERHVDHLVDTLVGLLVDRRRHLGRDGSPGPGH